METRRASIVNTNISLQGPSENDLVTIQRDRNRQEFAAQENERGPALAAQP